MRGVFIAMTAVCGILASAVGSAQALVLDYSFTNTVGDVAGTVTGHIDGIAASGTSVATAVYVDSYPAGLTNFGNYTTPFNVLAWTGGVVAENSFTVMGGVVTQALFEISDANGVDDQLYLNSDCGCEYGTGHTNFLDIGSNDENYVWSIGDLNASDGLTISVATGVPEASTWAMLLVGFASLGFATHLGAKRKNAAALFSA